VFSCVPDVQDHHQTKGVVFYLSLVFMLVSIIFLLLTVVAFFIAPEMQNLHGKCITCQSGSLMIAFVALTVIFLEISSSSDAVCKVVGMFWSFLLNNGLLKYFISVKLCLCHLIKN
jgi:multisubunit Na+/H+ antiporter MnhG subunit